MGYADSHIHIADPRFKGLDSGAELLFGCSSSPDEWDYLSRMVGGKVIRFYGTHPWYHDKTDMDGLERMLRDDKGANVGEIGLDSKRGPLDEQMPSFVSQLELAERYGRIANIHMIGCEEIMLKILREHNVTCILHSFSGPESYIRPFAECGCYFSISPRIHRKSKEKITQQDVDFVKEHCIWDGDLAWCINMENKMKYDNLSIIRKKLYKQQ